MPITPPGQDTGQALGDLFGNVNRPQLNAFVAASQARNGLVSAQTQDALIKAQQAQEEMEARDRLHSELVAGGMKPSEASIGTDVMKGHFGDFTTALKGLAMLRLGNPNNTPADQVSGQQMFEGKVAGPVTVPDNYIMPPGSPLANVPVQQSPEGAAKTGEQTALANLNAHKNQDPAAFRAGQFGNTSPQGIALLQQAMHDGRIDYARVNSRTAPILAQILQAEDPTNPTNFNRLHADATLQSNPTFQQKNMSADMLPGVLTHLVSLGKKLNGGTGYSNLKTAGEMQKWFRGELNDPAYTEYMTVRNDAMLRLANVMRGIGMSDKSVEMENEAMHPTLAPYALDAWLRGQMSVVQPMLDRQNKIVHLGEPGQGTPKAGAATSAPPAAAAPSLRDSVPGGAPPAAAAPTGGAVSLDEYLKKQGF